MGSLKKSFEAFTEKQLDKLTALKKAQTNSKTEQPAPNSKKHFNSNCNANRREDSSLLWDEKRE